MGLKRLFRRGPRGAERDSLPAHAPLAEDPTTVDEDDWLDSPPILRPAAIHRQVLYDPAESAPIWARPRQPAAPQPAAPQPTSSTVGTVDEVAVADADAAAIETPKPAKRKRSPKTTETPGTGRPTSKRVAKPKRAVTGG